MTELSTRAKEVIKRELKETFPIPEDSAQYIETIIEKAKTESDTIRDTLITGSKDRLDLSKKIDLESFMDILSILKDTKLLEKEWTISNLNDSIASSRRKLLKYKDENLYLNGLRRALKIAIDSHDKIEIIDTLQKEIELIS